MMRTTYFRVLSILAAVVFFAAKCHAETMTFGPTPYFSEADSPFDISGLGTTFFLEDFEDGEFNTPGVSPVGTVVRTPSSSTDSVDGDDGQIDGTGTLGYSLEPTFGICSATVDGTPSCSQSLSLEFDPVFDGQLPNAFGFVLTDNASLADITLTAFDSQNDVIGIISESGLDSGGTEGALFFGLAGTSSISTVWIRSLAAFEVDHLQYGIVVLDLGAMNPAIGDIDVDGSVSAQDIDALSAALRLGSNDPKFDMNADGELNHDDVSFWVTQLANTYFGDANLDGEFNSTDFITVFRAGKYEADRGASWNEGDWNADGLFDSADFTAAFQGGGYEQGRRGAASAIPEPYGTLGLLIGLVGVSIFRR